MSRLSRGRADRTRPEVSPPPDMPPAVATAAEPSWTVPTVFVAVLAIAYGYAAIRGSVGGFVLGSIAGVGAAFIAFKAYRAELAAGPGWLSTRDLFARHWVRTDQVVRIQDQPSGVDRVLTLHDRDGRHVGLMLADIRQYPKVRARLLADLRLSIAAGLVVPDGTRDRLGL